MQLQHYQAHVYTWLPLLFAQMQQNEDTIKQQQNEIEDLKRKLRLKDEAEAKVRRRLSGTKKFVGQSKRQVCKETNFEIDASQPHKSVILSSVEWRFNAPIGARVSRTDAAVGKRVRGQGALSR